MALTPDRHLRDAATLDLLSDGRLELGLGAGWMTVDYEKAGIPLDTPGVRIARLAESTTSTVTVGFTIARDSSVLAEGATTYIAVRAGSSAPLPDELRDA